MDFIVIAINTRESIKKKDRECTYYATFMRVRVNFLPWENNNMFCTYSVCVCVSECAGVCMCE